MHKIPNTFCPGKWDELHLNLNYNYAYGCCKATPIKFVKDYKSQLEQQKTNLLTGVQDPSCNYCWNLENNGQSSLRHEFLNKFDPDTFDSYTVDKIPKFVEVSLGNECNFQCTYCNPKFSSKWEQDVRQQPYRVFSDKFFYSIDSKEEHEGNLELLPPEIKNINIIGGEPLQNKNIWPILQLKNVEDVGITVTTNLSNKTTDQFDRLFATTNKINELRLCVSLDATDSIAEFARYGLDFALMQRNLQYLIDHAPDNLHIRILSLMTSITIRDLGNLIDYIAQLKMQHSRLVWEISYCRAPVIQSFSTLADEYKPKILEQITQIKQLDYVTGIDSLESALATYQYNNTLYQQLRLFLKEFSERKHIEIPICLN